MKKGLLFLSFLLLMFLITPVNASQKDWTEKKLGKVIVKADKAAQQKKWSRAIKYGEQMLEGSDVLNHHSDPRYINLLRNLNRYYDKANRLEEVGSRVIEAYRLSIEHLGQTHETTMTSRNLYYKLLIKRRDYQTAIGLVEENMFIYERRAQEGYRIHYYLTQLFSLYGITGQFEKEEKALLRLLEINRLLFGKEDQDNAEIIMNLAKNYCRQKKQIKFNQFVKLHDLKYICK